MFQSPLFWLLFSDFLITRVIKLFRKIDFYLSWAPFVYVIFPRAQKGRENFDASAQLHTTELFKFKGRRKPFYLHDCYVWGFSRQIYEFFSRIIWINAARLIARSFPVTLQSFYSLIMIKLKKNKVRRASVLPKKREI